MNYAKALKNKVTKKVGSVIAAPYVKYKEAQTRVTDRQTTFLKDYNAKAKRGYETDKERAIFNSIKDSYGNK